MQNISNTDPALPDDSACKVCGQATICDHLGVIRYQVPFGDPRFGKLFRCPNYDTAIDTRRQEILRQIGHLDALRDKTFETFNTNVGMLTTLENQSLQLAYQFAWQFAQNPEGWLLLEGTYGCGKTHLAAAVGNARVEKGDSVIFITTPDLLDHLRSAYGPSSEVGYDETFDRIRTTGVLILDDLGVENPSPWAQEKLFQLLNFRYVEKLPTVITTNVDVDRFDPRIRSRILHTDLTRRAKIVAPDYRTASGNETQQLTSNLHLYADMTFDSFVIERHLPPAERENLERAVDRAYEFAENPRGWLLLMGGYGVGKTHLAAAVAHHWRQKSTKVMFITVPDLLDYLRVTYDPGAGSSFDQRFQAVRKAEYLVLDDLGTENATPWAKEKLFQIIDYRYVTALPTLITTASELEQLNERIRSRVMDDRRCSVFAITAEGYTRRRRRKP